MPDADNAQTISIHALRRERDQVIKLFTVLRQISIHALRRERDDRRALCRISHNISIHALRRERDNDVDVVRGRYRNFNPRAPQGARHPGG